jgi:hypothetical protein
MESLFLLNIKLYNFKISFYGDWGLGIGDWGLGPIPNPQSPIPNPQSPIPILLLYSKYSKYLFIKYFYYIYKKIYG